MEDLTSVEIVGKVLYINVYNYSIVSTNVIVVGSDKIKLFKYVVIISIDSNWKIINILDEARYHHALVIFSIYYCSYFSQILLPSTVVCSKCSSLGRSSIIISIAFCAFHLRIIWDEAYRPSHREK